MELPVNKELPKGGQGSQLLSHVLYETSQLQAHRGTSLVPCRQQQGLALQDYRRLAGSHGALAMPCLGLSVPIYKPVALDMMTHCFPFQF